MTPDVSTQVGPLERLQGIQRYLNREGSAEEILLAVFGLIAFVIIVLLVHWLHKHAQPHDVDRPAKLYRQMIRSLDLSGPHRGLLRRVARDLRLSNPTVLLLGRRLFETHTRRWLDQARSVGSEDRQRLADLAAALFGPAHRHAMATSTGEHASQPPTQDQAQ